MADRDELLRKTFETEWLAKAFSRETYADEGDTVYCDAWVQGAWMAYRDLAPSDQSGNGEAVAQMSDTRKLGNMSVNDMWDAIGAYCDTVIDYELGNCGIGKRTSYLTFIAAAKRLETKIGKRTDLDKVTPTTRLHKDCAASQPSNAVPETVRFNATEAMIDAALKVDWSNEDERGAAHNIWNAMCAAIPAATVPPVVQVPSDAQLIAVFNKGCRTSTGSYVGTLGGIHAVATLLTTASNAGEAVKGGEA